MKNSTKLLGSNNNYVGIGPSAVVFVGMGNNCCNQPKESRAYCCRQQGITGDCCPKPKEEPEPEPVKEEPKKECNCTCCCNKTEPKPEPVLAEMAPLEVVNGEPKNETCNCCCNKTEPEPEPEPEEEEEPEQCCGNKTVKQIGPNRIVLVGMGPVKVVNGYPQQQQQQLVGSSLSYLKGIEDNNKERGFFLPVEEEEMDTPAPDFDASLNAGILQAALHSKLDKEQIREIATKHNSYQRQLIRYAYYIEVGRDLIEDLKKKLVGDFKNIMASLFKYPAEYDADEIYRGVKGAGTDEAALNDVIITRPHEELLLAEEYFNANHKETLKEKILGDCNKQYGPFLVGLLETKRDEDNDEADKEEAKQLVDTINIKDYTQFQEFLKKASFEKIKQFAKYYEEKNGKSLIHDIKNKIKNGDLKNVYIDIINYAIDDYAFFASRVRDAVHHAATNENKLDRAIIFGGQGEGLKKMANAYKELYDKDMFKDIKSDTSRRYKATFEDLFKKSEENH